MKRDSLVKLLRLTESDKDGEALAAIRRANKALRKAGVSWDDMIRTNPEAQPEAQPEYGENGRYPRANAMMRRWRAMCVEIIEAPDDRKYPKTNDFVRSLMALVDRGLALSPRQAAALEKTYFNMVSKWADAS